VAVMGRGSADEAVVIVKLIACEGAVMYLRVKLLASDKEVGGEGLNMLSNLENHYELEL